MENCPKCGAKFAKMREGVCVDCWQEIQKELDLHIEEYDRWNRMSDHQREAEIRRAMQ